VSAASPDSSEIALRRRRSPRRTVRFGQARPSWCKAMTARLKLDALVHSPIDSFFDQACERPSLRGHTGRVAGVPMNDAPSDRGRPPVATVHPSAGEGHRQHVAYGALRFMAFCRMGDGVVVR